MQQEHPRSGPAMTPQGTCLWLAFPNVWTPKSFANTGYCKELIDFLSYPRVFLRVK